MWPNPQVSADFVIFTEEVLNEKLHFMYHERLLYDAVIPVDYYSELNYLLRKDPLKSGLVKRTAKRLW